MALRRDSPSVLSSDFTHVSCSGEVAERSNAAVLKCVAFVFTPGSTSSPALVSCCLVQCEQAIYGLGEG
jgi:hypothetical protein